MVIHTYNGKSYDTQHLTSDELALQGLPNEPYFILETDEYIYYYTRTREITTQHKHQPLTPQEILIHLKEQDLQYHLDLMRPLL